MVWNMTSTMKKCQDSAKLELHSCKCEFQENLSAQNSASGQDFAACGSSKSPSQRKK